MLRCLILFATFEVGEGTRGSSVNAAVALTDLRAPSLRVKTYPRALAPSQALGDSPPFLGIWWCNASDPAFLFTYNSTNTGNNRTNSTTITDGLGRCMTAAWSPDPRSVSLCARARTTAPKKTPLTPPGP